MCTCTCTSMCMKMHRCTCRQVTYTSVYAHAHIHLRARQHAPTLVSLGALMPRVRHRRAPLTRIPARHTPPAPQPLARVVRVTAVMPGVAPPAQHVPVISRAAPPAAGERAQLHALLVAAEAADQRRVAPLICMHVCVYIQIYTDINICICVCTCILLVAAEAADQRRVAPLISMYVCVYVQT